jgi:hypothetical protein
MQGWSRNESRIKRVFVALPFFITFILAIKTLDVAAAIPMLALMIEEETVTWNASSVPLRTTFYSIKRLDDM